MSQIISDLQTMYEAGAFRQFIQRIRFPFFKNIAEDTVVHFSYPLSAFVGQNGCGKSSVLQALYGAPAGKSVRDFWFSTSVDPIDEVGEGKLRHCFAYSYGHSGSVNSDEVLKLRIRKKSNPEYWEPSRPYKKYGLRQSRRIDPVPKEVVYLDFRGELSAFDKFFYFGELTKTHRSTSKQDFIRRKSSQLQKILNDRSKIYKIRDVVLNSAAKPIEKTVLNAVSEILGRKYLAGTIVEHRLYKAPGTSVLFETKHSRYSEAFAGSGEMAVVKLVTDVVNAPDGSLILLDEPEVSLHPGAQRKMLYFLLHQAKNRKHQVVISTHSPTLIEPLPKQAVKLFRETASGSFDVVENVLPEQAFYYLGNPIAGKREVVVEDMLAKLLVERVANHMGADVSNMLHVSYRPGGADTIITKFAPVFSADDPWRTHLLLDGDQKKERLRLDRLPLREHTSNGLKAHIKETLGSDFAFYPPGGDLSSTENALVAMLQRFGEYWDNMVQYIPGQTPESLIWSSELALRELESVMNNEDAIACHAKIEAIGDNKKRFLELTESIHGTKEYYPSVCSKFIQNWMLKADESLDQLKTVIQVICDNHG